MAKSKTKEKENEAIKSHSSNRAPDEAMHFNASDTERPNQIEITVTEKIYKCDDCELSTNWKQSMDRHKLTHSGEKPFKCDICNYATTQSSNLKTHKLTHSGEKPFKCDICNYATTSSRGLKSHKTRNHIEDKLPLAPASNNPDLTESDYEEEGFII